MTIRIQFRFVLLLGGFVGTCIVAASQLTSDDRVQADHLRASPTLRNSDAREETAYRALFKLVKHASVETPYQRSTLKELESAKQLFADTLKSDVDRATLCERWKRLGFVVRNDLTTDKSIWFVSEQSDHRKGRGCFAFRFGDTENLTIQAPHCFYDRKTREISCRLFVESRANAAAWNTLHRSRFDIAHEDESYFNAFTRAAAESKNGLIIQLHGFSKQKRNSPSGREAEVVLSNGNRQVPKWLWQADVELSRVFGQQVVKTYPVDIEVAQYW